MRNQSPGAILPVGRLASKRRQFTLWDIMRVFRAGEIEEAIRELLDIANACEYIDERVTYDVDKDFRNRALDAVTEVESLCKDDGSQFSHTFNIAQTVLNELQDDVRCVKFAAVRAEVKHVADALLRDLHEHSFISVDSSLKQIVDNPEWMGKKVLTFFPDAEPDIVEAGNCLAVDCNTAAVFHLMRVVEWGLRSLCEHLHITRVRRSKKPKQKKYTPIAYSQWEKMLDAVHQKVDAKVDKMSPGKRKQQTQEFYYPLLQDLRAFKDAWRNHAMHSRTEYGAGEARIICQHVQRFMYRLAMTAQTSGIERQAG